MVPSLPLYLLAPSQAQLFRLRNIYRATLVHRHTVMRSGRGHCHFAIPYVARNGFRRARKRVAMPATARLMMGQKFPAASSL